MYHNSAYDDRKLRPDEVETLVQERDHYSGDIALHRTDQEAILVTDDPEKEPLEQLLCGEGQELRLRFRSGHKEESDAYGVYIREVP